MLKNWLLILSSLILIFLIVFLFNFNKISVIGNKKIITEINHLLIPTESKTITENDFSKLKGMVKSDSIASDEINELILLAKYKEYSHIGHGLGFLYDYIKTGKKPICPGHSLSHYYVFFGHLEIETAKSNLAEAKSNFPIWDSKMISYNETFRSEQNYTFYSSLINSSLSRIETGNNNASDLEISNLAEAPCVN